MLKNCSSITDNSTTATYTQCVQCITAGCHWSSSDKHCDWTQGPGPQLHIQDVCKDLHSRPDKEPEIISIYPNRVSFHGKNNVLLTGKNLESVTKIRIQGDLDCFSKESPVFDRSSDSLKFHVPPSESKGTLKVCAVTKDDRCHGDSSITYSSQPSCTGIQPKVTWRSGGRKIHVQGSNLKFVESIIVHPNKELETNYNTSSKDMWFLMNRYDGSDPIKLMLKVGNVTLDCAKLTHQPDPEFIGFKANRVSDSLVVNIEWRAVHFTHRPSVLSHLNSFIYQLPGVWRTHGTRMHYGKKASRQKQCDALSNVLLENLGSCHLCKCYFDAYPLPKHCCRPCTPFHGNGINGWHWKDNVPCQSKNSSGMV